MKHKTFYDLEHAKMYLSQSVIMIDKLPAFVIDVQQARNGSYAIIYRRLDSNIYTNHAVIDIEDDKVDFTPCPLGFLVSNKSRLVIRVPVRGWKVGLAGHNCGVSDLMTTRVGVGVTEQFLTSSALGRTIAGEYYSFPEIKEELKRGGAAPFSRRFCLVKRGSQYDVLYKSLPLPVGKIIENRPVLDKKYSYLQEVLKEDWVENY